MQEAELPRRRRDQNHVVRPHLALDELPDGLAHAFEAAGGEVHVVEEEGDVTTARDRARGGACGGGRRPFRRGRFFFQTPGGGALEEDDRHDAPVNFNLELFGPEAVNELARAVEDRHVRLHQLGLDAHDVFRLLRRGRRRLSLRAQTRRARRDEEQGR